MRVRRFSVRVADTAEEFVSAYCEKNPDYRDVWRKIIWHLEFRADELVNRQFEDICIAWVNLNPNFPLTTVFYTIDRNDDRPTVHVIHVRFDALH